MGEFLRSTEVKVYPSALRGGTDNTQQTEIYDPESRIGTEFNLNSAVNRLTIDGSFVIDKEIDSNGNLQFSIRGYYFKTKITDGGALGRLRFSESFGRPAEIWASIQLDKIGEVNDPYQIVCLTAPDSKILDDNGEFKGVQFSSTEETGNNKFSLKILTRALDGSYVVPKESYLRFDSSMVSINGTPLSDILTDEDGTKLVVDNLEVRNKLDANNIFSEDIKGSNGKIDKGVAEKAVNISDTEGNLLTRGNTTHPVFLNKGKIEAISTLAVEHGGTGKTNLQEVKVGSASNADVSDKLTLNNVGGVDKSTYGKIIDTTMYLNNGVPKEGMSLYVSNEAPSNAEGNDGDIWFKYN